MKKRQKLKVATLIKQLEKFQKEYGNLPVAVVDPEIYANFKSYKPGEAVLGLYSDEKNIPEYCFLWDFKTASKIWSKL